MVEILGKVDWKKISNSDGYKSLKTDVLKDCKGNCFNINGCSDIKAMSSKCSHRYCNKFRWVIDRAKHYSYKLNLSIEDVLNIWERKRRYWYMNYYQEYNQPKLNDNILIIDDINHFKSGYFRCSVCNIIINDHKKCPICGNKANNRDLKIIMRSTLEIHNIFKPID